MTGQPITPVDNGARDTLGRFASGPGNTGRPRNSRNAVSRATIKAVTDLFSEAVMVLKNRLAENDLNAAKIVLSIVLPKDRPIEFGEDISPATIEAALADGSITPQEAYAAAQSLEKLQSVRDVADLLLRVEELEAALAKGKAR